MERGGHALMQLSSNLRTLVNQDGGVILDLRQGKMFRLNPSGATILRLVAAGTTEKQIIDELCRLFSAEPEGASADVREFLKSLEGHQLLTYTDRNSS